MTERSIKFASLFVSVLIAAFFQPSAAADETTVTPLEHVAVYEILRKGNPVAKVTLSLSRQGETWTYRGFTHDMQGLGKVLHARGEQSVSGHWLDGHFQPETYEFSFSVVGYRSRWQAEFDWPGEKVITGKKSHKKTLSLATGAMDSMSLFLNTGSFLAAGQTKMAVDLIDEDEIKSHLYEAQPGVLLDTALGCMETTRVRRIRENSKRTSLAWYARDLGYIPVKMHHFKKEGKGMQAWIVSLLIDGQEIQLPAACPIDQQMAASG